MLRVVLPDVTFALGFHLQLSSRLCKKYRSIRYYTTGTEKNVTCPKWSVLILAVLVV